jgi:hypothetical protein
LEEDLLHYIFRVACILQNAQGDGVHRSAVPIEDLSHRGLIASADAPQQGTIVGYRSFRAIGSPVIEAWARISDSRTIRVANRIGYFVGHLRAEPILRLHHENSQTDLPQGAAVQ